MANKKIVYSVDFDQKNALERIKEMETEMQKIGEYHKRNLKELTLKLKTNIDRGQTIKELKSYKNEVEDVLKKFAKGDAAFDYKKVSFLNRELEQTKKLLGKYNNGLVGAFGRLSDWGKGLALSLGAGVIAGIAALKGFITDSAKAAVEGMRAMNNFALAVRNVGGTSEDVRKLNEVAQKWKDNSIFSDEEILKAISMGVSIRGTTKDMDKITEAVVNFSSATGVDLSTAMRIVTNAMNGQKEELRGYKIQLMEGETILDAITRTYAGQAESMNKMDGGMQNLGKTWEDFAKSVGKGIVIAWEPFVRILDSVLKKMTEITERMVGFSANEDMSLVLAKSGKSAQNLLEILKEYRKYIAKETSTMNNDSLSKKGLYKFQFEAEDNRNKLVAELKNKVGDNLFDYLNQHFKAKSIDDVVAGLEKYIKGLEKVKVNGKSYIDDQIKLAEANQKVKESFEKMNLALEDLEKTNQKTFGTRLLDAYKSSLGGVVGAIEKLGIAFGNLNDNLKGKDALEQKINQMKNDIESTKQLSNKTSNTEEKSKTAELLSKQSGDLDKYLKDYNGLMDGMANATVAVFQELAGLVKSFWDSYDNTLSELNQSTLSDSQKSAMAFQDAWKKSLEDLASQFGIIGQLVAKFIDSLWVTDSEKREATIKSISHEMSNFQHEMSIGVNKSLADQINFYEQILANQKEVGANEEDIWATEEKIYNLKKEQTAEMQKQVQAIKDIINLEATLGGKTPQMQVEYYQNKIKEAQSNLDQMGNKKGYGDLDSQINSARNNIAVLVKIREEWQAKWDNAVKWQWIVPKSSFEYIASEIKRAQDGIDSWQYIINQLQGQENAIDSFNNSIDTQNEIIKNSMEQLKLLQSDIIKYNMAQFEHELNMTDKTEDEKNKIRFEKYQEYLDQMKEADQYYDEEINKKMEELDKLNPNSDEAKTIQDELKALNDKRFSEEEIWSIEEKIYELKKAQTDEMKKQYDLLKQSGLFDTENLEQVRNFIADLKNQGLSSSAIYEQASGLGIGNSTISSVASRTINLYGDINNTMNGASPDALATNMVNILSRKIGGIM
jgi:hypothetical protein